MYVHTSPLLTSSVWSFLTILQPLIFKLSLSDNIEKSRYDSDKQIISDLLTPLKASRRSNFSKLQTAKSCSRYRVFLTPDLVQYRHIPKALVIQKQNKYLRLQKNKQSAISSLWSCCGNFTYCIENSYFYAPLHILAVITIKINSHGWFANTKLWLWEIYSSIC